MYGIYTLGWSPPHHLIQYDLSRANEYLGQVVFRQKITILLVILMQSFDLLG